MKSIFKLSALLGLATLLLSVVSCQQDELDTAQYADGKVTLASFGPNPVMRGAQLRFFGSSLEKIKTVQIPGISDICDIEVVASGKVSEIRVTVPVDGPEVGYVTLISEDGKKFTTVSQLTFTEPIVFDGFEAAEKVFPGDVITLKGDYMNLVESVTFEGGEKVLVNEGATRYAAQVVVPANALTGKIILSDGGTVENLFYSEEDLVMGEPTVNKNADATLKAGDEITFTGEHLEMIEKITIGDVTIEDFTLAEDNASITFSLPAEATDGTVNAVSFAGESYAAQEIETVVPTVSEVAPSPVKAGKTLTISGKDLDLVTKVSFDGAENVAFSYEDNALTVSVPSTAKEGNVVLALTNGKTVEAAFTLVHAAITSVSPLSVYAGDDTAIVVEGTDLDLVTEATLGGKAVTIKDQKETSLSLYTDVTSSTGTIALKLANGEELVSTEEVTVLYHSKVIVTSIPAAQHINEEVVISGEKLSLVETIYIGDAKVTSYSLRSDNEIKFLMPWNYVGKYDVKFVLYDGDVEVQANQIEVQLEREFKTLFEGSANVSWNNAVTIPASTVATWVKGGTELYVYYEVTSADYHMIRLINNDWSFNPDGDSNYNWSFNEDGYFVKLVDKALIDNLDGKDMAMSGYGCNITKVVTITEIAQETTIWEGSQKIAWNDNAAYLDVPGQKALTALSWGAYDWSQISAGTKLSVYFNLIPDDGYSVIRIGNGSWGALPTVAAMADEGNVSITESGVFQITLSEADLDVLVNQGGMVICGNGLDITKVTIL